MSMLAMVGGERCSAVICMRCELREVLRRRTGKSNRPDWQDSYNLAEVFHLGSGRVGEGSTGKRSSYSDCPHLLAYCLSDFKLCLACLFGRHCSLFLLFACLFMMQECDLVATMLLLDSSRGTPECMVSYTRSVWVKKEQPASVQPQLVTYLGHTQADQGHLGQGQASLQVQTTACHFRGRDWVFSKAYGCIRSSICYSRGPHVWLG